MTTIDNVLDSLDDIYQTLFEAGEEGGAAKDPNRPLSPVDIIRYLNYNEAEHKRNGIPYNKAADRAEMLKLKPQYVRSRIRAMQEKNQQIAEMNSRKDRGDDVSNLTYANHAMQKHDVRKSYYEAALDTIADVYAKYGVQFDKPATLRKIMADDKAVNDCGGWNQLNQSIKFVAHAFSDVKDMIKNSIIYNLRGGNKTFHTVVNNLTFFLANLNKVDQKTAVDEASIYNEMIITGLSKDQIVAAKKAKEKNDELRKIPQVPVKWKHMDDMDDEIYNIINPPVDEESGIVDLSHSFDNTAIMTDMLTGEPAVKDGESLGEYMSRQMYGCRKLSDQDRLGFYRLFADDYVKQGGFESVIDWPMDGENYPDYLQHMSRKPGEAMSDFACRIYYDSKVYYGDGIPGSIVKSMPTLKPDADHTAERMGVDNFAKNAFDDWLIANNMLAQSKNILKK